MKMPTPSSEYKPLDAGTHAATCFEIIDFGTQEDTYEGRTSSRRKIWIGWEIPGEQMSDGRNFVLGKEYTFSSSTKSTFRKHLEAWRGVPFTDADFGPEGDFDVRNVIGAGCMLSVNHNSNGRAVVSGVMSLPKGMGAPEGTRDSIYLSLEADDFDAPVFDGLSDWMKERISDSPEYQEVAGVPAGGSDDTPF